MKQLEPRNVTIGEYTFYIRPLPAFKAANMSGELASLILPLLGGLSPLIEKTGGDKGFMDIDLEEAAPVISGTFSGIDGDKLENTLRHLLIAGKNISFESNESDKAKLLTEDMANEIFCEEIQDMFLLAFEVIRTNYNGFFKRLAGRFGRIKDMVPIMAAR